MTHSAIDQAAAEKAVWWLKENALAIGQARAARIYMEQWVKTVKAQIQTDFGSMSVAAAEVMALSSPQYKEALEALKAAVQEDERLRFLATAAEAQIECWRSIEATKRAEGKAY